LIIAKISLKYVNNSSKPYNRILIIYIGQGIGGATAKLYAAHGAKVVVTDLDKGKNNLEISSYLLSNILIRAN
jgi:D-arabinose 1-dehydrogenase-like Zn-dependent alcohol dehydrogenase